MQDIVLYGWTDIGTALSIGVRAARKGKTDGDAKRNSSVTRLVQ
jgi:hypothetical protein